MDRICRDCERRLPNAAFYAYRRHRCKECDRSIAKKWLSENKARASENTKRWAKAHPEAVRAHSRAKAERRRKGLRIWFQGCFVGPRLPVGRSKVRRGERFAGPPKPKLADIFARDWFWVLLSCITKKERERVIARAAERRWARAHPESRRKNGKGHRRKSKVMALLRLQQGKCVGCREKLGPEFDVDHIISRAFGGTNELTNLQLLCKPCNNAKAARHPVEFMRARGFLL